MPHQLLSKKIIHLVYSLIKEDQQLIAETAVNTIAILTDSAYTKWRQHNVHYAQWVSKVANADQIQMRVELYIKF